MNILSIHHSKRQSYHYEQENFSHLCFVLFVIRKSKSYLLPDEERVAPPPIPEERLPPTFPLLFIDGLFVLLPELNVPLLFTLLLLFIVLVPPLRLVLFLVEFIVRSEEHTSELQSRPHLVCR